VDALAALAETWRFPDTITEALVGHHRPIRLGSRSPDEARLRGVCALVGMVGADVDPSEACRVPSMLRYARRELRLDRAELSSCAVGAARSAAEITPLTDPAGQAEIDTAHLLVMAKRQLQRHALEMEQRLEVLEAEHGRVLDEQQVLRAALGQYREQAARDPLTGLLNRRALRDAAQSCLEHSQQQGRSITVMFLDIDDFKQLNDRHGHRVGDEVLQAVAGRLLTLVEPWGAVGRYGGEEFVVVAAGLSEPDARGRAAEVLVAVRRAGRDVPGVPRAVTGSLGIVWSPCCRGRTAPALFAAADERMYRAKSNGKDRCCFARLAGAGEDGSTWPASRGGVPIAPGR
jgi:diguanylate cyclase (GGDEF)-like protein